MSGNVKLALSHVVPDLVLKVLKGQDPLHILGDGRPGPPLHLRRRPRPRHPAGDGVAGGGQRRLQPLDRGVDDGARAGRGDLAQDPRRRPAVPLRQRPAVRARRPAPRPGRPQGPRRPRLRGDDDARRRCSTRSSRGSAPKRRPDGCEASRPPSATGARALDRHARLQGGRGRRAGAARADGRRSRRRTRSSSSTTSTRTRPSRSSTAWPPSCPAVRGLRNDLGRGVLNAMKAGIAGVRRRRTS